MPYSPIKIMSPRYCVRPTLDYSSKTKILVVMRRRQTSIETLSGEESSQLELVYYKDGTKFFM